MGTVKHIWRQLRSTPDLLITYSRNSNFKLIGFSDASYSTGNSEKAKSTSGSMHFLSRGIIHSSARIFCDDKRALLLAAQGSYSSRSKHLAIRFMGLRDWIVDEKLVIDHVSTS